MMNKKPIIVISSSAAKTGKTTLALNLAAALWADGYHVVLFAPHNPTIAQFMQQRQQLATLCRRQFIMPEIIADLTQIPSDLPDKTVIIADIPTDKNAMYSDIFAQAHTLISTVAAQNNEKPFTSEYLDLIWNAKKQAASQGVKYLNWVTLTYTNAKNSNTNSDAVAQNAARYGYRIYRLAYRDVYNNIKSGYCPADMCLQKLPMKMTLADVYARHDILKLTDFLWWHK